MRQLTVYEEQALEKFKRATVDEFRRGLMPDEYAMMRRSFAAGLDTAAEQVAALTAELDGLRAALKPFADAAEVWQSEDSQRVLVYSRKGVKGQPDLLITVGDLLAAQRALDNPTT